MKSLHERAGLPISTTHILIRNWRNTSLLFCFWPVGIWLWFCIWFVGPRCAIESRTHLCSLIFRRILSGGFKMAWKSRWRFWILRVLFAVRFGPHIWRNLRTCSLSFCSDFLNGLFVGGSFWRMIKSAAKSIRVRLWHFCLTLRQYPFGIFRASFLTHIGVFPSPH